MKEKNFDATDYMIFFTDKYSCIVEAKSYEKAAAKKAIDEQASRHYEKYRRVQENAFNQAASRFLHLGMKVHIHSREGIYQVVDKGPTGFTITCNSWKARYERGDMPNNVMFVTYQDFKCYAGGVHNWTPRS